MPTESQIKILTKLRDNRLRFNLSTGSSENIADLNALIGAACVKVDEGDRCVCGGYHGTVTLSITRVGLETLLKGSVEEKLKPKTVLNGVELTPKETFHRPQNDRKLYQPALFLAPTRRRDRQVDRETIPGCLQSQERLGGMSLPPPYELKSGQWTDQIVVGEMFEGTRAQFADCFFSNPEDDLILEFAKGYEAKLTVNGKVIYDPEAISES